jgi:hypothetical protein
MIKLTKFPVQDGSSPIPTPTELKPLVTELRDAALKVGDFERALGLSFVHAWLYWLEENSKSLQEII